jgi:hypothetical protein
MSQQQIVRYAAAVWGGFGLCWFLWRFPGLIGFIGALAAGRVVDGSALDIPIVIFWALMELILISLAWGVFRRLSPAPTRLLVLLSALLGWGVVRAAVSGAAGGIVAFLASPWFWKDAVLVTLLLTPMGARAVGPPGRAEWNAHERRMAMARRIGESWRSVGRWDNTILIPVVFGTFLFIAPFTYFARGLFQLVVVLPLRPALWGR